MSNNRDVPEWLRRVTEEADAALRPLMPAIRAAAEHFDGARDVVAAVDAGLTELAAALRRPTPDQAVECQGGIVLAAISISGTGTITAVATVTSPPPALSRQAFLTLLAVLAGFVLLAARSDLSAEPQNTITYWCGVIGAVLTVIAVILKR